MSKILNLAELLIPSKSAVLLLNSPPSLHAPCWIKIWNESSFRSATDGAVNHLIKYCKKNEIKLPDLITGDFDSITETNKKYFYDKGVELLQTYDQDLTDMSKLLNEIEKREIMKTKESILILGGLGGRFDHTLASINSLLITNINKPIFLIDNQNLVTIIKNGKNEIIVDNEINKIFPGICGIIPIIQNETTVTTKGLYWDLNNDTLSFGKLISTSNQFDLNKNNNKIEINTTQPVIFTFFVDWQKFI